MQAAYVFDMRDGRNVELQDMGYSLYATKSTYDHLSKSGIACTMVSWASRCF